jgi:hypothetical protein
VNYVPYASQFDDLSYEPASERPRSGSGR